MSFNFIKPCIFYLDSAELSKLVHYFFIFRGASRVYGPIVVSSSLNLNQLYEIYACAFMHAYNSV